MTDNLHIQADMNTKTAERHQNCNDHSTEHAVIILASGLSQRLGTSKQLLTYQGQTLIQIMLNRALATHPQAVVVVVPKFNTDNIEDSANRLTNSLKSEINKVANSCDFASDRVLIVENNNPQSGMGHSLYLAIERLKQWHLHINPDYLNLNLLDCNFLNNDSANDAAAYIKRVIVMGVDQILMQSSHLNALLAICTQTVSTKGISTKPISTEVVASRYDKYYKVLSTDSDNADSDNSESALNQQLEPIIGLPIAISFQQLVKWQSQLSGDVGLRYLIRSLPANKLATVDNLRLSLDIDTSKQLNFAIEQGWLDPY